MSYPDRPLLAALVDPSLEESIMSWQDLVMVAIIHLVNELLYEKQRKEPKEYACGCNSTSLGG